MEPMKTLSIRQSPSPLSILRYHLTLLLCRHSLGMLDEWYSLLIRYSGIYIFPVNIHKPRNEPLMQWRESWINWPDDNVKTLSGERELQLEISVDILHCPVWNGRHFFSFRGSCTSCRKANNHLYCDIFPTIDFPSQFKFYDFVDTNNQF